ncbi:hypothetical protein LTS08_002399 [Lithohypha guttulata]|uniref:DNA mismatch repair protein HSM3 N-terminal domain-containing protein n=1 Tax=Lithohypha guttulata TaxID=1690604 RepID=A0AAN7YED1_9EURO|nr:hypothetical protein LTR05_000867 [Lithohypha guttulata]KAK5104509.1 hypothetical protein LTS08_002399 [Lithohypha guttulata]
MDQVVEDRSALFANVLRHLKEVKENPSVNLNEELLLRASRNADSHTPPLTLWETLRTGEETLQILQQDPRPLTRLLEQVVLSLPFDELKTTITSQKLEEGLKSPSVPVQLLILAYLRKAADLPSGAAFVACSPSLTSVLVTTWLSTESTEVSDKSLDTLIALLEVDSPSSSTFVVTHAASGEAYGQGLLWRRIFSDPGVYSLLFEWTTLTTKSRHDVTTKKGLKQATISQGRMLDFISRSVEIDWAQITTSTLPDVEKIYMKGDTSNQPYAGLLRYAVSDMIDPADDLMQFLRQDFFLKLLNVAEESNSRGMPVRLLAELQSNTGIGTGHSANGNGLHL